VVYVASIRATSALDEAGGEVGAAVGGAVGAAGGGAAIQDGERLSVPEKELGAVELFPQAVAHNANGRFVAVCGDNEYVIYTAQALRNKSFGSALDFAWSAHGAGDYAVRESTSRVKVFKNFKDAAAFRPAVPAEGLMGGALLCVRSADTVCFYDWDAPERLVRRIEVAAKGVYWNDSGELVAVATDDSFFVLRYNRDAAASAFAAAASDPATAAALAEEGVEAAFELQHEMPDRVRNGAWVGDCFLYTNATHRLSYYVGGETVTLAHLDRHMYLLGYLAKEGRVYLVDKGGAIVSYGLLLAMLEYQTAVVRRDFAAANRILPDIPRDHYNGIAKFLDGQGFKEQALAVADDADLKFDLAVQLNKLDVREMPLLWHRRLTAAMAR
jgi:coatomer subunit beta'